MSRRWVVGALLLAVAVHALLVTLFLPYGIDDAFISLVYARNLATGTGLVFQEGRAPVEGYSNFLWVVLLAPFARFDVDLFLVSKLLSAAAGAACLLMLWSMAARFNGSGSWWNCLPVGLLAISPVHSFWSAMGMETPLVALLLLALAYRLVHERDVSFPWSAVFACLLALARPEGILYAGAAFLYRLATRRRGHLRWLLPVVVLFGGYTAFRVSYFGQWLPNPYYAKTAAVGIDKLGELGKGLLYIARFLREQWHPALVALSIIALVPRTGRAAVAALWALVVCQMLFALAVGGDWMPNYRFLVPVLPLVLLLQQLGVAGLGAAMRRFSPLRSAARWPTAAVILGVLYLPSILYQAPGTTVSPSYMVTQARAAGHGPLSYPVSWVTTSMGAFVPFREVLRHLDDAGAQGATVAMQIVGYFAYEARGRYRVLDTAGITSADVARLIHAGEPLADQAVYVLGLQPEYVWLTARTPSLRPFRAQYPIDGAIERLPSFRTSFRHLATFGTKGHYQMLFGRFTSRRTPDGTSLSAPE